MSLTHDATDNERMRVRYRHIHTSWRLLVRDRDAHGSAGSLHSLDERLYARVHAQSIESFPRSAGLDVR
eukprot:7377748-Prymnesium_polylepis.1